MQQVMHEGSVMGFEIGDPVFTGQGRPARIIKKDDSRQDLVIDTDERQTSDQFRHGYLKGMSPDVRMNFNSLMDEIGHFDDVHDKIALLQEKISTFENHEVEGRRRLARYLKAELMHVMNSEGVTPRYYNIPVDQAPK